MDAERDELFREMVGAVVVGAVGGEYRQAVGVVVGTHQVVAGGLAGGVRAVGFVAVGFGEGGVVFGEGAVDFVGGDVEEAEVRLGLSLRVHSSGRARLRAGGRCRRCWSG